MILSLQRGGSWTWQLPPPQRRTVWWDNELSVMSYAGLGRARAISTRELVTFPHYSRTLLSPQIGQSVLEKINAESWEKPLASGRGWNTENAKSISLPQGMSNPLPLLWMTVFVLLREISTQADDYRLKAHAPP